MQVLGEPGGILQGFREDDSLEELSADSAPRSDEDGFGGQQRMRGADPSWNPPNERDGITHCIATLVETASTEDRIIIDRIFEIVENSYNVKFDESYRVTANLSSESLPRRGVDRLHLSSLDATMISARLLGCANQLKKGVIPHSQLLEPLLDLFSSSESAHYRSIYPEINELFEDNENGPYSRSAGRPSHLDHATLLKLVLNPQTSATYDKFVSLPDDVRSGAQLVLRFEKFKDVHSKLITEFSRLARLGGLNSAVTSLLLQKMGRTTASSLHDTKSLRKLLSDIMTSDCDMTPKGIQSRADSLFSTYRKLRKVRGTDTPFTLLSKVDAVRRELPAAHKEFLDVEVRKKDICLLARNVVNRVAALESRRAAMEEKEKKERMRLLRENDMDKYRQLVNQTKNQRLCELLDQTEKFLEQIGARIEIEKEVSTNIRDKQAAEEAAAAKKEADRKTARAAARRGLSQVKSEASLDGDGANGKAATTSTTTDPDRGDEQVDDETKPSSSSKPQYYTLTHGVKEVVRQPSILVGGTLMSYQMAGLEFLVSLYNNSISGILADEMGLGKTIQTIAFLAFLKESKNVNGPHLVAVPLSTLPNWANEFDRWCPSLKVLQYRGSKEERRALNHEMRKRKFNVLLTTFDFILREKRVLSYPRWKFIIVDEGHRMKNVRSKFHATLAEFRSTHRLLLTGTPLQNNLQELWSLMHFLLPCTFSSADDFERWFEEPFKDGMPGAEKDAALTEEEKMLVINRLHAVLRPFLLRRVKADVLQDLPKKMEYVIRIELSKWQKIVYEQLVQRTLTVCDASTGKFSKKTVANSVMQLRKVVNHPYLFKEEYKLDDGLYRTSGKFEVLDRMIPKLLAFKHKVLVFCQMTMVMDILADYFDYKGYKYHRLDGSVSIQDRQDRMDDFNSDNTDVYIFMLSTRAGSLGLNLQAADTVILFDSDWNPHQDLQAQARAHRVGQKNEVKVFRFVTVSGVEELVLAKAQHKLSIDEQIIQAGMFSNKYSEEEREERLRKLLCQQELETEVRVTTPAELNRFMARSPEEEETFCSIDKQIFGDKYYKKIFEDGDLTSEDVQTGSSSSELVCGTATSSSGDVETTSCFATGPEDRETSSSPRTPSVGAGTATDSNVSSLKSESRVAKFHADEIKHTSDKVESWLIDSGRLISDAEVPSELLVKIETPIDPETGLPPLDGPRKARCKEMTSCSSLLSEAGFNRAMDRFEAGDFQTFDEACADEYAKQTERRKRAQTTPRDDKDDSDDASEDAPVPDDSGDDSSDVETSINKRRPRVAGASAGESKTATPVKRKQIQAAPEEDSSLPMPSVKKGKVGDSGKSIGRPQKTPTVRKTPEAPPPQQQQSDGAPSLSGPRTRRQNTLLREQDHPIVPSTSTSSLNTAAGPSSSSSSLLGARRKRTRNASADYSANTSGDTADEAGSASSSLLSASKRKRPTAAATTVRLQSSEATTPRASNTPKSTTKCPTTASNVTR